MADEKTHIGGLQAAGMPDGGDGKAMDMNLADMLTAMIESTIAADQKAAEDYLEVLRTYALEPSEDRPGHEKLKMVDFEMNLAQSMRQAPATANYSGSTYTDDSYGPASSFDAKQ